MCTGGDIAGGCGESVVYQAVDVPKAGVVVPFGEADAASHHAVNGSGLLYGLAVALRYPLCGAVGRYGYQRYAAVVCLGECRGIVQHRGPRCADDGHGSAGGFRHSECCKGGRALVDDGGEPVPP